MITVQEIQDLKLQANSIRQDIIRMLVKAGSGHSAGSLGLTDIFTSLYFYILKHDPKNPNWAERDRLVLSSGHNAPVLYATLAHAGYFSPDKLSTLRKFGSSLQGHPHRAELPGIETTSGPLGCGLSQACGMALAAKMDHKTWRVICVMSDGEQDEGNTWEGVMLAAKYKLDNLVGVIDRNKIQIDGNTEDIMPLGDLKAKYVSFGWEVIEINGNDLGEIVNAFDQAKAIQGKPILILANTIPGKGVSFMEGDFRWHGKAPNEDEARQALSELGRLHE